MTVRRLWAAASAAAVGCLMAATLAAAAESAPSPVIERFLTIRDRVVRTTLFSNGVAVVSVRRGSESVMLRQRSLNQDLFAGYLAAIQRDAAEIAASDEPPTATGTGGSGVVTVNVLPSGPLRFTYSSLTVYDLATTRLLATLDDIEQLVVFDDPESAALASWQPAVGDLVKLRRGGLARVIEVRDDGALVLEHQSTYINELVPSGLIASVILEVVESR